MVLQVRVLSAPLARQLTVLVFGELSAAFGLQWTATLVLAGIPVQVLLFAVFVITTDAIVHIPIAVMAVPLVPNLTVPLTPSFAHGDAVPTHTFVPSSVRAPVPRVVESIHRAA